MASIYRDLLNLAVSFEEYCLSQAASICPRLTSLPVTSVSNVGSTVVELFCKRTIMFSSSGILNVNVFACGVMFVTSPMTVTFLLIYLGV